MKKVDAIELKALNMLLEAMEEQAKSWKLYKEDMNSKTWKKEFMRDFEKTSAMRKMVIELFGIDDSCLYVRNDIRDLIAKLEA